MFDIDNFKELNDRFGHGAGDAVLREVSRWIERNTRRSDVIGRYGGDEFIVCLPAIPADQAIVYAERMRSQVERLAVHAVPGGPPVGLKISLGVGSLDVDVETFDDLMAKVDKALYAAKQRGRNQVCVG
jgi:diguanylate cyclase (GGDEF)-like protein